jgi:dihydroflavonol-4-reductase
VVHVSTAAVYGDADWPITEESAFGPKCPSEYARTKRAGDLLAWDLSKEKGLPLVMIYPVAVLGPDDPKAPGRYVRNFARGKMPAQVLVNTIFSWVHVKDVCEAILRALEKENNRGEKYLIACQNLTFGEINKMISEISGAKLPIVKFPNFLTVLNSYLLTGLANLIRKHPIWDMSKDQIALMKQGFEVDGSKATRELGLAYTPVRVALEEAIASFSD